VLCRKAFGFTPLASLVAGALYQCSPYLLSYVNRTSVLLTPWAGLGWLLLATIQAARRGGWRWPATFALVVATIGGINATALALIALAPLAWLVHATLVSREITRRRAVVTAARLVVLSLAACGGEVAASRLTIPPDPYAKAQVTTTASQSTSTTAVPIKKKKSAFAVPTTPTTAADPGTLAGSAGADVAPAANSADLAAQSSIAPPPDTAAPETVPPDPTTTETVDPVTTTSTEAVPPGPPLADSLVAICDTASENALHAACVAEISVRSTPPSLTDLSCFVRIYRLEHADLVDDWTVRLDAATYQRVLSDIRTTCGLA